MVYFIGAGPGDPELLTVKGKRLIEEADIIIYAGSLVNALILKDAKQEAIIYNSASLTLEEVISIIEKGNRAGKQIVRIHTGDPSIFGAHREQMDALEKLNIAYEVVPGISSFLAAAAALKKEYTLPSISQTVILTRIEGRTSVPERERLEELARHRATLILFLSIEKIGEIADILKKEYPSSTKAAVVYKVSWEDEKMIEGTLEDIAEKVKQAGITRTALIIVGDCLGDVYEKSKLYDKEFSHMFRNAKEDKGMT